jgi:cytoskeletal protein CcmA (bactofilin family)
MRRAAPVIRGDAMMFEAVKTRTGLRMLVVLAAACLAAAEAVPADTTFADDRFMAGDEVVVQGAVAGDAFLAGGRVAVTAPVAGDVMVAGGSVTVSADVGQDVYVAGGSVSADSRIAGNVRMAGGSIDLQPRTRIEGSATLAGGRVGVQGSVGRGLQAFGQHVVIDGAIGGDVEVAAQQLVVGPNAHIDGTLRYRGPGEPQIAPGSEILGGIAPRAFEGQQAYSGWSQDDGPGRFIVSLGRFLWALGVFLLGSVMVLLMPAFTRRATSAVGAEPLVSIGFGIAVLFGVPMLVLFLFLTLVGIPLGLTAMFGYALLLLLGYTTGALFIGDWALARFARERTQSAGMRILALLGSLLLIVFLRRVPVVGPFAILALFLAGLGAWTLCAWRVFRPPPAATTA